MSEFQFFPDIDIILEKLKEDKSVSISGLSGSALSLFIFELSKKVKPVFFITKPEKLEKYGMEITGLVPEAICIDDKHPYFCDTSLIITALEYLEKDIKTKEHIKIRKSNYLKLDEILQRLEATGFTREEIVEDEYEYALRGGILDIYEPGQEPVRIELLDDRV